MLKIYGCIYPEGKMANYLLEIGVEELPAGFVGEAVERLADYLTQELNANHIKFAELSTFSTPRRLTAVVKDIATEQETTSQKKKGPPVKSSFDKDGKPLDSAKGFAQRNGLAVEALDQEEINGVTYLMANVTTEGRPTKEVLPSIVEKVVLQISGERLMRWGSCEVKFSRPLRWFISLLDDEVVPFTIAGINSGRVSRGHRILHPENVEVKNATSYEEDLHKAFVMVDSAKRKAKIEKEVEAKAKALKGTAPRLSSSLLDEVINLTEWPCAVVGDFENDYLELPAMLIETIMVHHQRYFPVRASESKLLPHFITISNNDAQGSEAKIKQGNERVLRARLADGKFFYHDDAKQKLGDRKDALGNLTYQEGLGSYLDKTNRLTKGSERLAKLVALSPEQSKDLSRVCALMKLDLVTGLVRELPELQGYVGSWYAAREGENDGVVAALASHYAPRNSQDKIAADRLGQMAGVIDKLDHIACLFALGKKPSGSSDPYGLRRSAQGLIDTLVDGLSDASVDLPSLISGALDDVIPTLKNSKVDKAAVLEDIRDFLTQRLKGKLLDLNYSRELVDCAMGVGEPLSDISSLLLRLKVLSKLLQNKDNHALIRVGVRVGNILKDDATTKVDESLLQEDAEKELWQAFQKEVGSKLKSDAPRSEGEFEKMFSHLATLTATVDNFFDKILVNDKDEQKRKNRHAILRNIDIHLKNVGDFTKLQPLIN